MQQEKTVLITGASAGIGYELAKVFASHGFQLVLHGRDEQRLNSVAKEIKEKWQIEAKLVMLDLAKTEAAHTLYTQLKKDGVHIDILVNNAGFGDWGAFAEADPKKLAEMIRLNIECLTMLSRLFLPDMLANKQGKILNVASVAGFVPGPFMSVYYATKAFVLSFSEALASEVKGTGVTVTALCPGATPTGFQKAANIGDMPLSKRLPDAAAVAKQGYNGLMASKPVVVPGLINKFLVFGPRLVPRSFVARVARYVNLNA